MIRRTSLGLRKGPHPFRVPRSCRDRGPPGCTRGRDLPWCGAYSIQASSALDRYAGDPIRHGLSSGYVARGSPVTLRLESRRYAGVRAAAAVGTLSLLLSTIILRKRLMRTARIGRWLGASLVAASLIGCGEEGAPPPKPGVVPAPPPEGAKLFQKPEKTPRGKTGALHDSPDPLRIGLLPPTLSHESAAVLPRFHGRSIGPMRPPIGRLSRSCLILAGWGWRARMSG